MASTEALALGAPKGVISKHHSALTFSDFFFLFACLPAELSFVCQGLSQKALRSGKPPLLPSGLSRPGGPFL